jgi:hypothetical protein
LVAEALGECAFEISGLKYTALANADRLGKKCRMPRGSYRKAVGKVCKKCELERSDLSMETALSRTNTRVVDDTATYPHEEVDAAVAFVASSVATGTPSSTCTTAAAAIGHTTACSAPTHTARSAPAPAPAVIACSAPAPAGTACSTAASQDDLKTFDLAAARDPAAPNAAPLNSTIYFETRMTVATTVETSAIVQSSGAIVQATGGIIAPAGIALPPALAGMIVMHHLMWGSN